MSMNKETPDIFNYTDYRKFLNDIFISFKIKNSKFSHRFIVREIGASSSGWFADILKNRINCTSGFVSKLSDVFKLTDKQKEYFELLVNYDQAASIEEKDKYLNRIMVMSTSVGSSVIGANKFAYFSRWYIPAIRELLFIFDFSNNFKELSEKICPRITVKQAKEAIDILITCGLISKNMDGLYKPCESVIEKDSSARSMLWATYMSEIITLGKQAIHEYKKDERDISAVTIALSKGSFMVACEKVRELRKSLLQLSETDKKRDEIYQVNIQLFPLSRLNAKE